MIVAEPAVAAAAAATEEAAAAEYNTHYRKNEVSAADLTRQFGNDVQKPSTPQFQAFSSVYSFSVPFPGPSSFFKTSAEKSRIF